MEIVAEAVEVTGAHSRLLAPTSLRVSSGELLVVSGEPNAGHTALGLVLSGRLPPGRGSVLRDGSPSTSALRRSVAVVDAPEITEPEPSVPVRTVAAEGLSLAGRSARRGAVRSWLSARGLAEHASTRMENLPPAERTRLLVYLAGAAESVGALVLDTPDRHGGDPRDWYELALRESRRQRAVVLLCSAHSADRLDVPHVRIGGSEPAVTAETGRTGEARPAEGTATREAVSLTGDTAPADAANDPRTTERTETNDEARAGEGSR